MFITLTNAIPWATGPGVAGQARLPRGGSGWFVKLPTHRWKQFCSNSLCLFNKDFLAGREEGGVTAD